MINELIFLGYIAIVSGSALIALRLGKEALVSLICVQWVLANLFVTKQITLCGLNATTSDALAVGATLCLNLVQEYFGKELAQKTIIIGFCSTLFYTALSFLQVLYIPSTYDTAHIHFCALLAPMPRIVLASVFTYLIVQQIDFYLFGFLKKRMVNRSLTVRNYISVSITQLIDTVLFSFLGLYGLVASIRDIIVISYGVKLVILVIAAPCLALSHYFYKPNFNKPTDV
jgi:uncharacterized integral membrane protein (TIGR00697 family)